MWLLGQILLASLCSCNTVNRQAIGPPFNGSQDNPSTTRPMKYYSFEEFMRKFHKEYAFPGERSRRETIFLYNQARSFVSFARYTSGESTMYMAINQMSDLTPEELRLQLHHTPPASSDELHNHPETLARLLASKRVVDDDSGVEWDEEDCGMEWEDVEAEWRRRKYPDSRPGLRDKVFTDRRGDDCLDAAKSQGTCGSCAVFSTIGLYEWAFCKQHGAKVNFSEQYVLDCAASEMDVHVCEDGIYETSVASFVGDHGFELADPYEYQGVECDCPYGGKVPGKKRGFIRLDRPQLMELPVYKFEDQLRISPLIVGFYLDDDTFASYGGGVDLNENCNKSNSPHSMLMVGSGRERGIEYWLLRNSHGDDWGEQGHYRIKKINDCYSREGFGQTMEVFVGDDGEGAKEPSLPLGHKFVKNPSYDWKLLAKALVSSKPPEMPKRKTPA